VTLSPNVVGMKETIAACGFETQAPEPGAHSFTCELIEVLDKWKFRVPFSVAMLHGQLLANLRHPKPKKDMFGKLVESRRTPVYVVTTANAKAISIELARRHSEPADRMLRNQSVSPMAIPGSFPSKSHVRRPEWSFQHIPIAPKVPSLDTRSDLSNRAKGINALTSHPTLARDHALGGLLSPEPKLERSDSYHAQLSMSTPQYKMPQQSPFALMHPSCRAWNPQDDQTLVAARAQGMSWALIQQTYFPSKTPHACRKRHERLMERHTLDDFDGLKLEILAKNYMGMRREIWSGLGAQVGEKWNVVEQKVPSSID
jgi:hypothetical protein